MESGKMVQMNLFSGQEQRCKHRVNGLADTVGEGAGGTNREQH